MPAAHLLRGLVKIAGWMVYSLAFSALVAWRWNHEMVRVYDFPAIPWWSPGAVFFGLLALFVCVKWREIFAP